MIATARTRAFQVDGLAPRPHAHAVPDSSHFAGNTLDDPIRISADDWDALFRAVEARLCAAVSERLLEAVEKDPLDAATSVQAVVLECAGALNQLHTALTCERQLRSANEADVFSTKN